MFNFKSIKIRPFNIINSFPNLISFICKYRIAKGLVTEANPIDSIALNWVILSVR